MNLGIFGGTFDPPHMGHLILADEARAQLKLDRLLWVLSPNPPHKREQRITPLEHRLRMLNAALKGNECFELSRVEIDRPGPHFAVETVKLLAMAHPDDRLVYLMGGDSLRDLPDWRDPAVFIATCHSLGVMRRPGRPVNMEALEARLPGISDKVRWIDAPLLDIASSQIRQRVAEGEPFRYFLPAGVYQYIVEKGLYASAQYELKAEP